MSVFKSPKEKRYWFFALLVWLAIYSTLAFGRPFQEMLRDQNIQLLFFLVGMILTGTTIIIHGLKVRPSNTEIVIWLGMVAVYIMLVFRLGAPERSHVIEYSVLAIFIHKAIIERFSHSRVIKQGLIALSITVLIGILDEILQIFLPNRVFDLQDIAFNSLAALFAIGGSITIQWARKKFGKNN